MRFTTRRASLRSEDGWAVLTALLLMTIMLASSLTLATYTDNQTTQGKVSRNRETAFNVAEGAMNGQVFALAQNWPGAGVDATARFTGGCTQTSTGTQCPNAAQLLGRFPTSDAKGATWALQVRDNDDGAPNFYSDAANPTIGYDRNDDGLLWVRAEATARGKTRRLVALVRAETQQEDTFRTALLSGRVDLQNLGNKTTIDDTGANVTVRCVPVNGESIPCAGYGAPVSASEQSKLAVQIAPVGVSTGYTGPPAISTESVSRLKATAISQGNYFTSCPSSLQGRAAGQIVYVDTTANCSYTGNAVYNNAFSPGVIIMNRGVLSLGGGVTFYGIVYHANADNWGASNPAAVDLGGTACVQGSVMVEGNATTHIGSSGSGCAGGGNVSYSSSAFGAVKSIGKAGIVQNTWRELASR